MSLGRLLLLLGLILVSVAGISFLLITRPPSGSTSIKDGAAVLTLIAAAAVGIERAIEMFWTVVGSKVGSWWPMNIIASHLDEATSSLGSVVDTFYTQAASALTAAGKAGKLSASGLQAASQELADQKASISAKLADLQRLAPGDQRAALMAATVVKGVNYVDARYGDLVDNLKVPLDVANTSIQAANDFLGTFKDNPGRRLLSLWFGILIGLPVAAWLSLDVFQAILGEAGSKPTAVGVLMTGFVIGLGSGPTHEVIGVLQEVRKSRKSANDSTVTMNRNGGA